jgi:MoaA/NifB/PqqE/SkfB family radical SAM enzyme
VPEWLSFKKVGGCGIVMLSICDYIFGVKIELSSKCNASCSICPRTKEKLDRNGFMSFDIFKKIIDELDYECSFIDTKNRTKVYEQTISNINQKFPLLMNYFSDFLLYSVENGKLVIKLYGYGESLLNPEIYSIINYLKNKDFHVVLTTNGNLIGEEVFDKILSLGVINEINISIDSHINKVYEKIRCDLNLDKILIKLTNLSKRIKENHITTSLHIAIVKTNENENSVKDTLKFFNDLGFSASIDEDIYFRTKLDSFYCPYLQHTLFIYSNGNVNKCCLDPVGQTKIGNIELESLRNIWFGEKNLKYLIKNINSQLNTIETCKKYCLK